MSGAAHLWLAFLALTLLEIVLGIDNVIFLSILVGRLPPPLRTRARIGGLALAMLTRLALLMAVIGLTRLSRPWLHLAGRSFSARDLVLLGGGLFLLGKSVFEIHYELEGPAAERVRAAEFASAQRTGLHGSLPGVLAQIALIDVVFSFDSVFTAVGLVRQLPVMMAAIVVAIVAMMWISRPIGAFIGRHPTIKVLALAFLLLIGMALLAEGLHFEVPKGYLYFAMAFAVSVELINMRVRSGRRDPRG